MRLHGESAWTGRRRARPCLGRRAVSPDSRRLALDPALEVSQYAHTSWTVRDGFSLGNVYAMAQTPDGYLWLGSEFGLFRFDGVSFVRGSLPTVSNCLSRNINSLSSHVMAPSGSVRLPAWRAGATGA